MKQFKLLRWLLLVPGLAFSQDVLQSFDTALDSSYWAFEHVGSSTQTYTNLFYVNDIVHKGAGSMKVDYAIQGTESWGGYANIMHGADSTEVFDFSPYTHLKVWYYNAIPQSIPSTTHIRVLLKDMSNVAVNDRIMANITQAEFWYSHFFILDAAPGWNELVLPLTDVGAQSDQGVWLPGWAGQAGNSTLDLDKIKAWKIEWSIDGSVYNAANPQASGISTGTIYFDDLRLTGHAYPVINYFDNTASQPATYAGTGASSISVTDNTTEFFETASAQFEWKVDAPESWGGFASLTYGDDNSYLPNMAGHTHMTLRYNNLIASSMPGNVVFRIQLYDYSEGDNSQEQWIFETRAVLDSAAGWKKLIIPLEDRGPGVGPNAEGFSNPGWSGVPGNSKLDWDKVKKYEFAFSAAQQGTVSQGTILFDNLELYGKRQTDFEPPAVVQGVAAVPDANQNFNLVIWQDVPNEQGERYTVYASQQPITDVNAAGVEVIADGVVENTQTFVHYLRHPLVDKAVTYYYAVRAVDRVGNVGEAGVSSAGVANTAKGVATISLNVPANVVIDGDLSEWYASGIKPFEYKQSISHVGLGTFDNDDDLSITMFMAMDNEYLYFAVDAIDNVHSYDPAGNWYEDDAIEMFLGLYDGRPGPPHLARLRGEKPDYALQYRYDGLFNADNGNFQIYNRDSTNYYFEGFGSDYIIETKIRLSDITFGSDAPFTPVNGTRIPLDFSIHDSDVANVRDGVMALSPINNDNSWSSPRNWTYTWIGDKDSPTGVAEAQDNVPTVYSLSQNYPNPFNPTTNIVYTLPKSGAVKVELFNALGQKVRTLVDEFKAAGKYTVTIQAETLPTGVYFYRIKAGDYKQVRKMLLMK